ncbi:MAG: Gfo/Idh/MocA family oxidoreductase [Bryobacteraceae bacterium]|nr:Gfo/Idh/MocA family oxidoreductase [Bryobacteraceae bacterium]
MPWTDRRKFLLGSVAGLVGSSALAAPDREVRTAVIGVGKRGTNLLTQVLQQPNVKVTAICDTDAKARDDAQGTARRDNPRSFTDYRKLLEFNDVDAVVVATPCYLHSEMAAAALDAGKYVYCEKPVGITPVQVDNVLKAAARSKTFLQIGQQLRYVQPLRDVIRKIQEDKIIGEEFVIKAQRHSTPVSPASELARPAWYKDVKLSGDLIVENAVHNLDVCNWVAGSRPVSAYGHGKKYFPKPIPAGTEMMDGFSVEYIYQNDVHVDYSQLYMHPRLLKVLAGGQWYMVFGSKGTVDLTEGVLYPLDGSKPVQLIRPEQRGEEENATSEFYACIREGRKPFADVKIAATAALTAILGREAIYKRRSVTWDELGVQV